MNCNPNTTNTSLSSPELILPSTVPPTFIKLNFSFKEEAVLRGKWVTHVLGGEYLWLRKGYILAYKVFLVNKTEILLHGENGKIFPYKDFKLEYFKRIPDQATSLDGVPIKYITHDKTKI